ncbi:MAG TPA: zf-HC2 domain-containing protein [Vicinamibacterales bacterium]|nr:zf-HC2 domain-containing protein [Vicinamibacterales bacterium]
MTDITCTFAGDREQTLIAYLYDDIDASERAAFDGHLSECARCRRDLASLGGVRRRLASWEPPQVSSLKAHLSPSGVQPAAIDRWYRQIPAWAQVAAALLFLGVSAAIANLDVRYDASGLTIRTGWSRPASTVAATTPPAAINQMHPVSLVNRDDLAALEQRLRGEIKTAAAAQPVRTPSAVDADTIRRVRALIDDSEKREERELALRVAQVLRDVTVQRQADLAKIDRNLGLIQNSTGVEILKQREAVNYLLRVSQRQ